jgi:predicted nucleotidyltransferase
MKALNLQDQDERLYSFNEKDRLIDSIYTFFKKREGVLSCYLFGSFVKGGVGHDIDIGVFTTKFLDEFRIGSELEGFLFEKNLKIPVDLRILNGSPIYVKYEVIKEGIRVYTSSLDDAVELEARIISEYLDMRPALDFYNKKFLERAFHR